MKYYDGLDMSGLLHTAPIIYSCGSLTPKKQNTEALPSSLNHVGRPLLWCITNQDDWTETPRLSGAFRQAFTLSISCSRETTTVGFTLCEDYCVASVHMLSSLFASISFP